MAITQANAECPALLFAYREANKTNNLTNITDPVGMLDALHDPTNLGATRQEIIGLDGELGHKKPIRIHRKQRQIAANTAAVKSCPPVGAEKANFEEVITPTLYRTIPITVSETAVRKMCDTYSRIVSTPNTKSDKDFKLMAEHWDETMIDFNAIRQAINSDLLTAVATKFGAWKGGVVGASKSFPVYRSVDAAAGSVGSPILAGFNEFMQEIRRSTFNGKPIVVGEGKFDLANMALQFGRCNNGGTDFGKMSEQAMYKFYREVAIATATGSADGLVAFMPGSLQFVSYNEYVGSFARAIGTVQRGTIPDPFTKGLVYDMRLFPDECGNSYTLELGLNFDLYAAPTTLFKAGDTTVGINGVFKGLATGI